MWFFIALFILAVNAQNNTDASPDKESGSAKVEPKNVSALYIGDLLRTKPKDDLEVAGSVHRPQIANQDLVSAASMPYKSHGGHEYAEAGYETTYPESRVTGSVKRIGEQASSVPFKVKGHILTLKPVRIVPADNVPTSRNPGRNPKDARYPGEDCSKSSDRSYSSEEKPYAPETYRRAKQTASNPELEYRSPPSSYYDDDRSEAYSSHSDPSSGSYRSRAYPSRTNTKSESSGSYTTSKSTSSSKTITPSKTKASRIVPPDMSNKENFDKNFGGPRDQGFVAYKVKEPSNQKPSSYSESSEKDYPPPDYDRGHKPAVREPYYSQHSSGPRKSRKYTHTKPSPYSSSEPNDGPPQYGPPHYEENQGGYEQDSYRPDDDQRYREQDKPSDNYNENKYAHPYSESEPENKPYQQNYPSPSEEPPYSNTEQKSKPYQSNKKPNMQYEKPPNRGSGPRTRGQSTPEYTQTYESQTPGGPKGIPERNYHSQTAPYSHTETSPAPQSYNRPQQSYERPPQSYDRTHHDVRQTEKQPNQYQYDTTPYQTSTKQSETPPSRKRPYRESSPRYARSPEQPSVIVEGRALLPAAGNQPVIMISRESKPYVSRSESFSESDYTMGNKRNLKANYGQLKKSRTNEGRHAINPNYQTSYKPFNSEYPASYANDPHHRSPRRQTPQPYERPLRQPDSYNPPVYTQTHSHSGEAPQHYQAGKQESYRQGETNYGNEDSSEQARRPVKKSKNHHYISNIEGYKDTYGPDEPIIINEEFFKKYGISPKAKVIVANPENPNLFVADGTQIKEGEYFENSGPISSPNFESKPDSGYEADSGPNSGPGYESNPDSGYGAHSAGSEEDTEPSYKNNAKDVSYSSSPEEFGPPKLLPGSFDDLVDTNPKFLRHLPELMKNEDGFFKMDSTEDSFDDVAVPKVAEQRGYVVSQGPGEIVQQHGDGVSRIVFNVPKAEFKSESSNVPRIQAKEDVEERIVEAATNLIKDIIKSESKNR